MKLSAMKPESKSLVRKFSFPDGADPLFSVEIAYTPPAQFAELQLQAQQRFIRQAKPDASSTANDLRKSASHEVMLAVVRGCYGVTLGKLRELLPIDAAKVAELGGPDTAVPMDPATPEGRENLLELLNEGRLFLDWVLSVAQNLGRFQDADWEDRAKNLSSGQSSSGAATPSLPTPKV